jgi:ABC-type branched-subunit amino acid transport system ATPase component
MQPIISVRNLSKTYTSGFQALKGINLEIRRGEIFALLGPNGAGKTTLIGIICGIVNATEGVVLVDGDDVVTAYRATRSKIGRPARTDDRCIRNRLGYGQLQSRAVWQATKPRLYRKGDQGLVPLGQEGQ